MHCKKLAPATTHTPLTLRPHNLLGFDDGDLPVQRGQTLLSLYFADDQMGCFEQNGLCVANEIRLILSTWARDQQHYFKTTFTASHRANTCFPQSQYGKARQLDSALELLFSANFDPIYRFALTNIGGLKRGLPACVQARLKVHTHTHRDRRLNCRGWNAPVQRIC